MPSTTHSATDRSWTSPFSALGPALRALSWAGLALLAGFAVLLLLSLTGVLG